MSPYARGALKLTLAVGVAFVIVWNVIGIHFN